MDKETEDLINNEFKVNPGGLTNQEKTIVQWFEDRKLLRYKELRPMNLFLLRKFQRLLERRGPTAFFQDMIQSLDKEVKNIILISTEWFSDGGTNDPNLLKANDEIDVTVLYDLWRSYYEDKYRSFAFFDPTNIPYDNPKDAYQRIFLNLYDYCGVPDQDLRYFLDDDFQLYQSLIKAVAASHIDHDPGICYDLLVANFNFPPSAAPIRTAEDLDELILASPEHYDGLVNFCLDQFTAVRRCTEALLESLFTPGKPHPNADLNGDDAATIKQFESFNELLKKILAIETEPIESKHRKGIQEYLDIVNEGTIKGSGFKGMAERQLAFLQKFDPVAEYDAFQLMTPVQRVQKVKDRNKDMENISAFHRLSFDLEGRDSLNTKERKIFYEKLSAIVQNSSVTVYSDIIELYFIFF